MNNTANEIANGIKIPEETPNAKALREAKEQLILINGILERPEIKRILDNIQTSIPFLSDTDSRQLADKINKFHASSLHTAMCAAQTTPRDDFSFLIDRTKSLKDALCKIFDDVTFYIQFTRGAAKAEMDEQEERAERRYIEILLIVANAYRELTNLPVIEMPKLCVLAHQGTAQKKR